MKDLTIGELAKSAEVNPETISYYERQGLIQKPPRLQPGYRAFPGQTVDQIRFIKQGQELGFSLKENQRVNWTKSFLGLGFYFKQRFVFDDFPSRHIQ